MKVVGGRGGSGCEGRREREGRMKVVGERETREGV